MSDKNGRIDTESVTDKSLAYIMYAVFTCGNRVPCDSGELRIVGFSMYCSQIQRIYSLRRKRVVHKYDSSTVTNKAMFSGLFRFALVSESRNSGEDQLC